MARLMQDWLLSFVKQELEKAIDWKKSKAYNSKDHNSDYSIVKDEEQAASAYLPARRSVTDDGSNLRVSVDLSEAYEHAVQIVKYLEYEHPVKAVISDSHTSIIAKFSKVATEAYERNNHGRRITKITTGGIMSICRCEIVATTYGPESERLSLLITELAYRGSGGSPTFGHPSPIERKPEVAHCIEGLITAKKAEISKTQQRPEARLDSEEALSQADDKNNVFQTQACSFASQIPYDSQPEHFTRSDNFEAGKIRGVNSDGPKAPAAAKTARSSFNLDIDDQNIAVTNNSEPQNDCLNKANHSSVHLAEGSGRSVAEQNKNSTKMSRNNSKKQRKSLGKSLRSIPEPTNLDDSARFASQTPKVPEWMAGQIPNVNVTAWVPSEPGVQFPLANIPIRILDELKNSNGKFVKSNIESNISAELNKHNQRRDKLEGDAASQSNVSYLAESEESESEKISWSTSNDDLTGDGLPPDSSILQERLSAGYSPQSQQCAIKVMVDASKSQIRKDDVLLRDWSKERRSDHFDEDSGLEMCLPGEIQIQTHKSPANFDYGAKSFSYKEHDITKLNSQPHNSDHLHTQLDTNSYPKAKTSHGGDSEMMSILSDNQYKNILPRVESTTVIPNTPSRGADRLKLPKIRQSSDGHGNIRTTCNSKNWKSTSIPSSTEERTTTLEKKTAVAHVEGLFNDITPNTLVNGHSLESEAIEREYGTGNITIGGHKKLKMQHPASDFAQNSPAFLESACQAHEAKRDFLRMLATTKTSSSQNDSALTSSNISGTPANILSQSLPGDTGTSPTKKNVTISKDKKFGQILDGSIQPQSSVENLKIATAPSISQEQSVGHCATAMGSKPSSRTHSIIVSPSKIKPCESATTSSSTPLVNNVVYMTFREVYPDYKGDLKHFLGICRAIDISQQAGTAQHRSLWDDFVVKHITDYGPYLISCNAAEEPPISYEQYYRDRVDEPCHNKRILTPESLREALDLNTKDSLSNSVETGNFQPFSNSASDVFNGSRASSRRRKGKKIGYLSSSPASIQWHRESHRRGQAQDGSGVVGSARILPSRGRNVNTQRHLHGVIRSGPNSPFERREYHSASENSAARSRNSSRSLNHVSVSDAIPFASSPLGGKSIVHGGDAGYTKQAPYSEGSWKKGQTRRSKPIPVPLHHVEKSTTAPLLSSLPLSSSLSKSSLPLSGPLLHAQTQSDNDNDTRENKIPALQDNTEYGRGRVKDDIHHLSLPTLHSASFPTSPAVDTNSTDGTKVSIEQRHEHDSKANMSSLPISSTTNQILQQTLQAEQLRNQEDDRARKSKTIQSQQGSNPERWWREQHTVFKEFVTGYAQLKNVNGSLGMPVSENHDVSELRSSGTVNAEAQKLSDNKGKETTIGMRQKGTNRKEKLRKSRRQKGVDVLSWNI